MPLNKASSFKCALFVAVLVSLTSSCVTQRRCMQKYPPIPVTADTVEIVAYRDTIIYVTLPADTITDSVTVVMPCPEADGFKSDTVRVSNDLANAKAWISENYLRVQLRINEKTLALKIDSAVRASTKTITIVKNVVVEKRVVPVFYRATLFVSIILILLFVVIIWIALRR
jgi:hypothetical protein